MLPDADKRNIRFTVVAHTSAKQFVCLTGNRKELGMWDSKNCVHLKHSSLGNSPTSSCHSKISCASVGVIGNEFTDDISIWSTTLAFRGQKPIEYRYMICMMLDTYENHINGEHRRPIIVKWETMLEPRKYVIGNRCVDVELGIDTFGSVKSGGQVMDGWLSGQTEIQLRFSSSSVLFWQPSQRSIPYRIKCTPNFCKKFEDKDIDARELKVAHVLVSSLDDTHYEPQVQGLHGTPHDNTLYTVIRVQTFEPDYLGYTLEFIQQPTEYTNSCVTIGYVYLLPFTCDDRAGSRVRHISDTNNKSIGRVHFEYFIATPMPEQVCDMSASYALYWRSRGSLEVGHRGMGSSFVKGESNPNLTQRTENTVDSLSMAAVKGADYVEFDVQLTKDLIPIVYHDFKVMVGDVNSQRQSEVSIKDCTARQLWSMELYHHTAVEEKLNRASDDLSAFPPLEECFERIEAHVGFNIEMKYPMIQETGEMEDGLQDSYFERNLYTDVILEHIFKYAGSRRIVMSSFDPDICILLRLKQNRYPVLFLSFASCPKYPLYLDERTHTLSHAINLARAYQFLGLSMETSLILKEPDCVTRVKEAGLVLFCWGEDTNQEAVCQTLRELGVDGIIHDRMDRVKSKMNLFLMESRDRMDNLLTTVDNRPSHEIHSLSHGVITC